MINIEEIIAEFSRLQSIKNSYTGDKFSLYQEMNMLAQKIEQYTAEQYNKNCKIYKNLNRTNNPELWSILLNEAENYLGKKTNELSLLDVGTSDGNAIEYASSLGINVLGVDNSSGFINELQEKASAGKIPIKSFLFSSMCDINVKDKQFDIVRMNASLLHLPIIEKGFTVDLALSEANRVLKDKGLLFVSVKYGSGLALHDTKEGLGKRVFQFYDHELLNDILTRNGFVTTVSLDRFKNRNGETIHWIIHIAKKC
jgi:ubiquinone/menaquinone biosynthesis C-methylase UbiE